ncbi:MAG: hypothetical protein MK102_05705 [Fuerstiella sp.]|nr:hypothetical protein [Fuerstiella sp.]
MSRSSSRNTSKFSQLTIQQRFMRWCFRPRRLVIAAAVALGVLLWPQLRRKLPDVKSLPEYQVGIAQISISPPPRWIPENLVVEILHRVNMEMPMSLQNPKLSERIAAAFVTHPWIREVHRVTKSFPPRVHVDVTYRRPVAIVDGAGGYYAIDDAGCVLPGGDFRRSDVARYPIVENVSSVPQGGQGLPWGDPVVEGAAQLAALLTESDEASSSCWETWALKAIRAPSVLGAADEGLDFQYELTTAGGSSIIWGRAPASQHPGELSAARKLQRLSEYYEDFRDDGGFDTSPIAQVIDVRGWRGITLSDKGEVETISR